VHFVGDASGRRSGGRAIAEPAGRLDRGDGGLDAPQATNNRSDFEHIQKLRLLEPRTDIAPGTDGGIFKSAGSDQPVTRRVRRPLK
jgi:hypothetical protein